MSDLTDEQAGRIEHALAAFERPDGAARARLLAALTADDPPSSQPIRRSRDQMMRRYASGTAIAATMLLATAFAWHLNRPSNLFAEVTGAISKAEGFRCDLVQVTPGYAGAENAELVGHVYWTPDGAERIDYIEDGEPESTVVFRPGHDDLRLEHGSKHYKILPGSAAREFSFGLFGGLGKFRGDADPIPGQKEIRGVAAEGFTVSWAEVVGGDNHGDATIRVWIDPATNLPVRVDLEGLNPRGSGLLRLEGFRWGSQDLALFDATPPDGYTEQTLDGFPADEIARYIAYGLATFAKYNHGRYPEVTFVYGDEQGEALRKLMGMPADAQGWVMPDENLRWEDSKQGEFAHGSAGLSWINVVQRDLPEGAYRGKTVTPEDVSKVLVRWRREDGDYQVIFGDLSTSAVPTARLRELESD